MTFKTLQDFLNYFESLNHFPHHQLCSTEYTIESENEESKKYLLYEQLAFGFAYLNDSEKIYSPMMTYRKPDGTEVGSPDRSLVNDECIRYWLKRSKETKSNFMKFRYLLLLIDFTSDVFSKEDFIKEFNKNYFHDLSNEAINIGLKIVKNKNFEENLFGRYYLELMLRISKSYSQDRLKEIADACINLENDISDDNFPGLWGFSLRYLLLSDVKSKNVLTKEQEQGIIKDMENRLIRLKKLDSVYGYEICSELLLLYYKDNPNKVKELLDGLESVYLSKESNGINPMVLASKFDNLKELYLLYDNRNHKKIDEINGKLASLGSEILNGMQTIESKVTITDEEMDKIIEEYYDIKKHQLNEGAFAIRMIPHKNESEETLKKLIKEFPFQYLITKKVYDKRGTCIGVLEGIDGINGDKSFNLQLINQYHNDITISGIRLDKVCSLIKTYNKDTNYLKRGILKEVIGDELLDKIRELYVNGKNLEFCCLGIPIIESVFREILDKVGGIIVKNVGGTGACEYKTLGEILNDPVFQNVFSEVLREFPYYCRVLFTEKHGFNLRNILSHGIDLQLFYSDLPANRIFHVLFCLSLLSFQKK